MYAWQESDLGQQPLSALNHIEAKLEKRRIQLIAKLPFDGEVDKSTNVVDEATIKEWLALLVERDRVAKLKVYKANQAEFSACISQLHGILAQVKQFDEQYFPMPLKQGVCTLFTETSSYLSHSKQNSVAKSPQRVADSGIESPNDSGLKPFTPRRLPDFSKLKPTPRSAKPSSDVTLSTRRSSRRVVDTPKTNGASAKIPRTPKTVDALRTQDLRKSLLKSKDRLRQTPGVKRSPGRTPFKKQRVLDMRDQSDLVTYALRRKFQNVRRLYGSPSAEADTSINISID